MPVESDLEYLKRVLAILEKEQEDEEDGRRQEKVFAYVYLYSKVS